MNKFALALLFTAAPFFAAADELPKAETILDRFVEVVGGKAAFEKHHNEVTHGNMEFVGRGLKGTMTVYQAAPDQIRVTIDIEGAGKFDSGTSGDVAWENSAMSGPRIKQGIEKSDAFRDATFNSALYWRKLYTKAETSGVETVQDHECYKVVLTPPKGNPTTHYYDKKSGLLIKTATTRATQMGDIAAEIFADDYRKEGDILAAHKITNKLPSQEIQITVQSLEFNVDMPKDRFDMPDDIKALLKKPAVAPSQSAPAAAASSSAAGPSNAGKLTLYMTGKQIATENYTVQKSDGKIEVNGSANAAIGPIKIDIEQFKVETDEKFQPLDAVAKGKLGQVQMNVKTTFADGKAKNEMDSGQGPQSKEDAVSPNALVVSETFPLYPWSLLALRAEMKNQDPQQIPVYFLGRAEVPGTVVFKGRETVEFAGKTAELNHLVVSGTPPEGQPLSLDLWMDDNRKVIKIAVPARGVEAYQDGFDRKAPPEAPKPVSKP
ncbi:MAG TPA: hypothetical protein VGP62_16840 [Bryobacteraceae bacterium]|jgi:hypothetical protein|nr:hypothetical protein [Bryobacteraceae bacterium]